MTNTVQMIRQQRAERRALRHARQALKVACDQVGVACGFVEVGNSRDQVRMAFAHKSGGEMAETLHAEVVRVNEGTILPSIRHLRAVYTVCDNREALVPQGAL